MAGAVAGQTFTFPASLTSAGSFVTNPTLAAGDVTVSVDGGAYSNIDTLPTVTPAGGSDIQVTLSAAETTGASNIVVSFSDVAGSQWDDVKYIVPVGETNINSLVRATTPANTIDVNATGNVGIDLDNTTGDFETADFQDGFFTAAKFAANAITSTVVSDSFITAAKFAPDSITSTVVANGFITVSKLSAGTITATTFANNAITSNVIAADAIDASALATDAIQEIVDGVWDELTAGHVIVGSFGEAVVSGGGAVDVASINGSVPAAVRLALAAAQEIPGTIDTATFAATSTEFEADDITEATADHYKGRNVLFTTGSLAGQMSDITVYALTGGKGHFTVTALTEAPSNNDTFVII